MLMTISEWLNKSVINCLDAELILTQYLGASDRSYLVAHSNDELVDTSVIDNQAARRADGEPLAYILGYREFYGRRFFVTPDVLIPRPETEDIIDIAKRLKPAKILDVGTGSGCIAITLALELPDAEVSAIDISSEALRQAQKNAAHHHAKILFCKSDLLSNYHPSAGTLIVANLPYVDATWDWLNRRSLDFEPTSALYAEQSGLELIYRLIDQTPTGCPLLLEADPCQHKSIVEYAKSQGFKLAKKQNYILHFTAKTAQTTSL